MDTYQIRIQARFDTYQIPLKAFDIWAAAQIIYPQKIYVRRKLLPVLLCVNSPCLNCETKTHPFSPILADFSQFLADLEPILADFSRLLADFLPILAKETPEFFDKIKAGEFTLKYWC